VRSGTRPSLEAVSRGKLITLEGGEGVGKSTHLPLLADHLAALGLDVLKTREPGGVSSAESIRTVLVTGEVGRWDPMSEALLHFAARREHLVRVVWPALARGQWVLCDRFADSTMAYQGYGLGLGREPLERLYALVVGDFAPDLTIILDVLPEVGLERTARRRHDEDRYERMDPAFHARLREGFLDIARREPERCVVVDSSGPTAEVQARLRAAVSERLRPVPA